MSLQRVLPGAARCLRQRLPAVSVPIQRRLHSGAPQAGGIPIPYITEVTVCSPAAPGFPDDALR